MATKVCKRCEQQREVEFFNKDRSRADGRFPYCKECSRAHGRRASAKVRDREKRIPAEKCCAKCSRTKPANRFNKNERQTDGLAAYCKECESQRLATYYTENREERIAAAAAWQTQNPEVVRDSQRRRYWRNPEQARQRHRELRRARTPAQREHYRRYAAAYSREHRSERASRQNKRRALKLDAFVEFVDRDEVHRRDSGRCYLCRRRVRLGRMHLEHVVPLSRGGVHAYSNCRCACPRCNLQKGCKLLAELGGVS